MTLLETTEKVATAEYFDLLALDNQLLDRLLQPRPLKSLILSVRFDVGVIRNNLRKYFPRDRGKLAMSSANC